jgi:glycine/sarcosine N-methyltransferase
MDARRFYDSLASDYHLVYSDWESSVRRQSEAIGRLLAEAGVNPPDGVLDCACGIGTQAIGLARLGYRITATDISPRAVSRAAREFRRRGLGRLTARVSDFRRFPTEFADRFPAVICMDNPLAHMVSVPDLRDAFRSLFGVLRAGGPLIVSSRDYDAVLVTRPTQMPIRRAIVNRRTTIVFQVWSWEPDEPVYTNEQFLLRQGAAGWRVGHLATRMRAHTRSEITEAALDAGFGAVEWKDPDQSGYFQPVMMARKA